MKLFRLALDIIDHGLVSVRHEATHQVIWPNN